MKVFEVLNLNRELLMRINEIGIRLDDCRFVDLYNDYEEMKAKGMDDIQQARCSAGMDG